METVGTKAFVINYQYTQIFLLFFFFFVLEFLKCKSQISWQMDDWNHNI